MQTRPTVAAWPAAQARAWSRASAPWPLPFVVLLGAVAGAVAGIVGEGNAPCDPAHPSVCGPEVDFALALVLLVGSVLLQWTHPLLGCALGVAFAVLDMAYDNPLAGRFFAGHLILCLGVAGWVVVSRERQRNLVRAIGGVGVGAQFSPSGPPAREGRWGWQDVMALFPLDRHAVRALVGHQPTRVLGALLLVAVAAGAGVIYDQAVNAESNHLARAIRVDAKVADGPDDAQRFTPVSNLPGGPRAVELTPLEWYPEGSIQPILLDPADPEWVRLVAEPDDQTWWLTIAAGALLLALVLAAREVSARRGRTSLRGGTHPGLSARLARMPGGEVFVLPTDSDVVVATFISRPTAMAVAHDMEPWPPPIQSAVVYGDLRHAGWVAAQTAGGLVLPEAPVRAIRNPAPYAAVTREGQDDDDYDVDLERVGDEVVTRRALDPGFLPFSDANPWWLRAIGAVLVTAVVTLGPYAAWAWTERFTDLWPILVLGGTALERGVRWLGTGLQITRNRVQVDTGFTRRELPFGRIDAVRVHHDTVYLVGGEEAVSFDPCPEVTPRSARESRVREVAEMLRGLVDDAASDERPARGRIGVGALAVGVFVLGVGVTGVVQHLI